MDAIFYISQARASDDSSTVRMKRASLVKAGEALSPDAFMLVLDGESNTKDPSTSKGPPTSLGRLAGRAKQFEKGVSKAAGHLKRLGDENDQERLVKEFLGSLKAGRDSSVVIVFVHYGKEGYCSSVSRTSVVKNLKLKSKHLT